MFLLLWVLFSSTFRGLVVTLPAKILRNIDILELLKSKFSVFSLALADHYCLCQQLLIWILSTVSFVCSNNKSCCVEVKMRRPTEMKVDTWQQGLFPKSLLQFRQQLLLIMSWSFSSHKFCQHHLWSLEVNLYTLPFFTIFDTIAIDASSFR